MNVIRTFTLCLLLLPWVAPAAAQEGAGARAPSAAPAVTISTSAGGVRVVALGGVGQMRLEVLGAGGETLYSSGFRPGSVRDWALDDSRGGRLPDGAYLCVVTFLDLAGRPGVKQGTVVLQAGQASLQLPEADQLGPGEAERRLSPVAGEGGAGVTLTAHDGADGQVVTTRGGLSFRAGDFFAGREKELMRLTPDGDLGLGVRSPEAKLDVAGAIRARGGIQFDDGSVLTSARGAAPGAGPPSANKLSPGVGGTAAAVGGTGTANRLAKWTDEAGTLGNSSVAESGGNIGIGTAAPLFPLHVSNPTFGQVYVSGGSAADFLMYHTGAPANARWTGLRSQNGRGKISSFTDAGAYRVENILTWDNATGSVGVGTAAPTNVFEVRKDQPFNGNFSTMTQLVVRNDNPNGFSAISIWGNGAERGRYQYNSAQPNIFLTSMGLVPFYFGTDGAVRMSVDAATGNVGIGTGFTPATQKLEVAGNVRVTGNAVIDGNIAAKYQDVAEWVPASGDVRAGTVVALDVTRYNAVAPSTRAYDTRVAGVVSAQPGLILGEGGAGKVLVATTGRVKVRVDATRRAVRVGDLLVTSGRPGVAMRSVPVRAGETLLHRPGTIIGKALEPLAGREGEILVLLSLQ